VAVICYTRTPDLKVSAIAGEFDCKQYMLKIMIVILGHIFSRKATSLKLSGCVTKVIAVSDVIIILT